MNQESIKDVFFNQDLKPGNHLRQLRKEKGLSQEQIAAQLHLSLKQIESIENDDYSYTQARVYAKGHLNLYARLLGAPANDIIRAFDKLQPEAEIVLPEKTLPLINPTINLKPKWSLANLRWVILSLAALTVLFLLINLISHGSKNRIQPQGVLTVAPGDGNEIKQVKSTTTIAVPTLAPAQSSLTPAISLKSADINNNQIANNKDRKKSLAD